MDADAENLQAKPENNANAGILMSINEHNKLELTTKILIYYRIVIKELVEKNSAGNSSEWLQKPRFYFKSLSENESQVIVKVLIIKIATSINYAV